MYSTLRLLLLTVCAVGLSQAFVPCADPSGSKGHWIGRDRECAALVQTNCKRPGNGQIGLTSSWRKDVQVKGNCDRIPTLTAIATFLGPNDGYNGGPAKHTAIFISCDDIKGVYVWHQHNNAPINNATFPWKGRSPQQTGDNYWTIA